MRGHGCSSGYRIDSGLCHSGNAAHTSPARDSRQLQTTLPPLTAGSLLARPSGTVPHARIFGSLGRRHCGLRHCRSRPEAAPIAEPWAKTCLRVAAQLHRGPPIDAHCAACRARRWTLVRKPTLGRDDVSVIRTCLRAGRLGLAATRHPVTLLPLVCASAARRGRVLAASRYRSGEPPTLSLGGQRIPRRANLKTVLIRWPS
jgi:hypothetical protein